MPCANCNNDLAMDNSNLCPDCHREATSEDFNSTLQDTPEREDEREED